MPSELIFISGFIIFILLMLAIDLGLFGKSRQTGEHETGRHHERGLGIAGADLLWADFTLRRICCTMSIVLPRLQEINIKNFHHLKLNPADFAGSLSLYRKNLALEFITGYVVEYALSVDNIFVMVLIFTAFAVNPKYYHKVLVMGYYRRHRHAFPVYFSWGDADQPVPLDIVPVSARSWCIPAS